MNSKLHTPDSLSTQELIELASLDAMGLLDEHDRLAFDKAFEAASPALQAQLRREQTRVALFQAVLPKVDPPLGLRAKVLASIRQAALEAADAVGIVRNRTRTSDSADIVAAIRPSSGVSRLWRVGAVAAAAASIALTFSILQLKRDYDSINTTIASNAVTDEMRERYGMGFDRLLFDDTSSIIKLLAADSADSSRNRPSGVILFDASPSASSRKGIFLVQGLTSGEQYQLVARDNDGRVIKTLVQFTASPANRENRPFDSLSLENVASVALIRVRDNTTVLVGSVRA